VAGGVRLGIGAAFGRVILPGRVAHQTRRGRVWCAGAIGSPDFIASSPESKSPRPRSGPRGWPECLAAEKRWLTAEDTGPAEAHPEKTSHPAAAQVAQTSLLRRFSRRDFARAALPV